MIRRITADQTVAAETFRHKSQAEHGAVELGADIGNFGRGAVGVDVGRIERAVGGAAAVALPVGVGDKIDQIALVDAENAGIRRADSELVSGIVTLTADNPAERRVQNQIYLFAPRTVVVIFQLLIKTVGQIKVGAQLIGIVKTVLRQQAEVETRRQMIAGPVIGIAGIGMAVSKQRPRFSHCLKSPFPGLGRGADQSRANGRYRCFFHRIFPVYCLLLPV